MTNKNVSIVYATKTGHSRKIAEAIGKELNVQPKNMKEEPEIKDVDLLFLVGGIYGGQSLPQTIHYIESLDKNMVKKVALITSCTSKITPQTAIRTILQDKGIEVIEDEFICQGNFLFFGLGHPNKIEISNAVKYANELVQR